MGLCVTRGPGETYLLVGADGERDSITAVHGTLLVMGQEENDFDWVRDRSGNNRRYAIDSSKFRRELG